MDGSDGKLETGAEVEARGAVRAEDGEARLPAEVQVAEEERPGGVAGRRGNGLRPEASSQIGKSNPPKSIDVVINGGTADELKRTGTVLGVDRDCDLAVVRIDGDASRPASSFAD